MYAIQSSQVSYQVSHEPFLCCCACFSACRGTLTAVQVADAADCPDGMILQHRMADLSLAWGWGCKGMTSNSEAADRMRDIPPRTRPSSCKPP